MKEKLRQIIKILKGETVTLTDFKSKVAELATINDVLKYHTATISSGKYSTESFYRTTFKCYIDGFNHTKEYSLMEDCLEDMKNQINRPIPKDIEVLL